MDIEPGEPSVVSIHLLAGCSAYRGGAGLWEVIFQGAGYWDWVLGWFCKVPML